MKATIRPTHPLRQWWPSALTVIFVLWATLAPNPTPDLDITGFLGKYADKIIHAIMMGGITGAIIFDYMRRRVNGQPRTIKHTTILWIAVGVLIFAAIDECAQGAMGLGRTTDPMDFVADAAGILIATLTAPAACRYVIRHTRA